MSLLRFSFIFGVVVIAAFTFVAIAAPWIAPFAPDRMFTGPRLAAPSGAHLFGTDALGRDVLSRILFGTRYTIYIGLIAVAIGLGCGTAMGLIAAYSRSWLRGGLMRLVDLLYSFPEILIALAIVAFAGPSLENAMVAVGISRIPFFARVAYSVVLVERNKPYFDSGRAIGAGPVRLMLRYLLPNIVAPLLVLGSLGFATSILAAAGLSFIGLGVQPPLSEWGALVAEGRNYMRNAPWLMLFPGISIMLVVLAFNLVGDTLSEYVDPRRRWTR